MFRPLLTLILAITLAFPAYSAERDSLKLLTIGNSFSNDAVRQLPQIAKAKGKELTIGRATIGGCSLERHARHLSEAIAGDENGRAYKAFEDPKTGAKRDVSLIEALQATDWDIVTIQQVSSLSYKRESFQPYMDQLIAAVREHAPKAEIVIHQTWAYREDHDFFKRNDGFTPLKMYEDLTANYRHFADEKGFRILPTGDALHLARQTPRWTYVPDPSFDFKNPPAGELPEQRTSLNVGWRWSKNKAGESAFGLDAIHCNNAGQYLGANVWYATLFETDTLADNFTPPGLTTGDTANLRAIALAAVQAERKREAALPVLATATN